MPFRKHALLAENSWLSHSTWRPYLSQMAMLFALLWAWVYQRIGDKIILRLLPAEARRYIAEKKTKDLQFEKVCRINGTAFINALIAVPIAVITMIRLDEDHYHYESKVFDWAALVLLGYFLWDFLICIQYVDYFGYTFVVHAVISLIANWLLLYAKEVRTSWLAAALVATEVSTPFLHLRWFLIQGKTRGWYLQIINLLFLATFIGYRLIGVECLAIFPFTKELLHWSQGHPPYRLIFELAVSWLWASLNYYWGFLLIMSQFRQLKKWASQKCRVVAHQD